MLKLIIEDDEGRKTVVPFVRDEITIGRQEGNTIRLTERNVSRRHARLLRHNGAVVVEDLGSYNGIRINGEKITGRASVADGDLIQIGDYDLAIQREGADQPVPHVPAPPAEATNGAHRGNGAAAHHPEPVTEAMSPAYEEAEPISGEEEEPTSEIDRPGDPELARRQSTSIIRVDQVEGARKRDVKELDPEEAPRLVVLNTEFAGREFACIRTELRVGRTDDNDITLDHRSLSRTHAKLVREENGEWRIIDMQSANGLQVNGEPYAQATLNHLDTVELGHVKLKFVAAGESFTFVPGAEDKPAGAAAKAPGSKTGLYIGAAVVVLAAAGVGAFFAFGNKKPPQETPPQKVATAPTPAPAPVKPAVVEEPKKAPEPVKPDPAVAAAAEAKQKIEAARAAMASHDFDRAVELLEGARQIENVPRGVVADADDLLDQARAEQMLSRRLDDAEKAIASGNLDDAKEALDQAAATAAFQERHKELDAALNQKLAEKKKLAAAAAAARANESAKVEKAVETRKTDSADEAKKLFDEGLALFNKKQHREAKTVFGKCLETDPTFARCHLMLGSTYARLGDVDEGAKHYEMFLRLAPTAQEAPKVRIMLEQYKASKKGSNQ